MTIYKFPPGEKKPPLEVYETDAVVDLLQPEVRDEPAPSSTMTFLVKIKHRRRLLYFLIGLALVIFVACLAVGAVYICYRFSLRGKPNVYGVESMRGDSQIQEKVDLSKKPLVYGLNYFENEREERDNRPHGFLEERLFIPDSELFIERIEVPRFDECESAVIMHDFIYNYTAIVDIAHTRCFVMNLNRSQVLPPRDVIDLAKKIWTGHYMPKARTLREKYKVYPQPIRDVTVFGKFVANECYQYTTFKLIKSRAHYRMMMQRLRRLTFGYFAFGDNLIKIQILD